MSKELHNQSAKCCCRCHKGNLGICLWCQGQQCTEFHPLFQNIKSNYKDTHISDLLGKIRK